VNTAPDRFEVVANDAGDRTTATYMALVAGELLFGHSGKNAMVRYPMQTVAHVLPITSPDVVNANTFRVGCEVEVRPGKVEDDEERVVFPSLDVDDEEAVHDAMTILTQFLTRFRSAAVEGACGGASPAAVALAIPRYLSVGPYASVLESAGYSGLLHVMYSDIAAALAYADAVPRSVTSSTDQHSILVADWGAKTLCLSLLRCSGGALDHVTHRVSYQCGGVVIDKEIQNYGAQCFQKKTRMDPRDNARSMRKLLIAAEEKKRALSSTTTSNIEIEAFCEGIDLKEPISRVKLESIIREKDLCGAFDRLLDELMEDAVGLFERDGIPKITRVILAGGTLRIPVLSQYVRGVAQRLPQQQKWTSCVSESVVALDSIASDEVTAVGACVQATAAATRGGRSAPAPPANGTAVADGDLASTRSLATSLYWLTGQPSQVRRASAAAWVTERTNVKLLFPVGVPTPMDVTVELSEPTSAPATLLVLAEVPNVADLAASDIALSAVTRQRLVCPAGVKKLTWILSEDRNSATMHVMTEDAAGKKTLLTRGQPLELSEALTD